MIEVYAIKLVENPMFEYVKKELSGYLPKESKEAVLRHKTEKGAQRTLLGELLSRIIISQKTDLPTHKIHYRKTVKGKPYIPDSFVHFNVSHSGEWVVLAVADVEVGIDIEVLREVNYRVATRFFSTEENDLLEQVIGNEKLELFFDFWTLKESYLKLLGTGLTKSLSSFSIVRDNNIYKLNENTNNKQEPVFMRQYHLSDEYKLSICSYVDEFVEELKVVTIEELLRLKN